MKIAKAEHVKVIELASANKLTKTAALKVGQKLTIPAKAEAPVTAVASATPAIGSATAPVTSAISGNSYTVKSGDSLWKIAKANNVSVASLKQANSLTSDSLKVNQKLVIPAAAATTPVTAPVTTANVGAWQPGMQVDNGQTTHIVDIGETVGSIAKKYNVSVAELMKANNISDVKRVTVSQKLVIPSAAAPMPVLTTATPAIAAPIVSTN